MANPASMPRRTVVEVVLLIAIIFFFSLQEAMLSPAFPAILKSFHVGPAESGWFTSASLIGTALAVPLLGRLADLHDKGRIVLYITASALLGSATCFFASAFPVLLAGQVLIGLCYALHPLGVALMADLLPKEKIPHGTGFVMGASIGGTTLGLVAAGPMMDAFGYHGIYAVPSVILAVLALLLLHVHRGRPRVHSATPQTAPVDWMGAALLGMSTLLLLGLIIRGQAMGWGAPVTLLLIAGFVASFTAWLRVEQSHPSPLVDFSFFQLRELNMAYVVCAVCGIGAIAPGMLIPLMLQAASAGGTGAQGVTETGLSLVPLGIAASIAAPLCGTLRRALGGNLCLVVGMALLCAGNVSLWLWHDGVLAIVIGMALTGAGVGIGSTETMNVIVAITGAQRAASACSIAYVVKGIAAMSTAQVCAAFLGAATDPVTKTTLPYGYSNGFQFCIVLCFVGIFAALAAHRRPADGVLRQA